MRLSAGSTEALRHRRLSERTAERRRARPVHAMVHAVPEANGRAVQRLSKRVAPHTKDVGCCNPRRPQNDDIAHPIVERSAAAGKAKGHVDQRPVTDESTVYVHGTAGEKASG